MKMKTATITKAPCIVVKETVTADFLEADKDPGNIEVLTVQFIQYILSSKNLWGTI